MATKRKTTSTPAQADTTAVAAPAAAPTPSLQFIDLDVIDTLPQVRTVFDEEPLAELADSIKLRGMLQPILLRGGQGKLGNRYVVIAGERRLRAARLAGLTAVPALVGDVSDELVPEMQLIENIQREQLSLAETAAGVLQLYEKHQAQKPIAKLLGKSVPWVSKHLAVATKLAYQANRLLELGEIEDLDLLMTLDQIDRLYKWHPHGADLVEKIKQKKAGRTEARALLAALRKEIELANQAKKKAPKTSSTKPEPPKWDAASEMSTLHDSLLEKDHKPVEELLADLKADQLGKMAEQFSREWSDGEKVQKATSVVKLRAMVRFMDTEYCNVSFEAAAFILGSSGIELTVENLATELHQLVHAE
jgi:ParB/RepB/Spo0J family partition protein